MNAELRHGKLDEVLRRFTDVVSHGCYGVRYGYCFEKGKGCDAKRQPAMLHKFKALKRDARRELRRTKRSGRDVLSAHQHFMRAVRAHHDLVNMISTKKNLKKDVFERRRFLHNPH